MKAFVFWSILVAIVGTFIGLTLIGGCAPVHPLAPAPKPHVLPSPHQDPPELKPVGISLNYIIVLATVVAGAGVGLYFVMPAAHNLSLTIAGVAGGIQIVSLVTRVSLWFIPYVVLILGIGAVAFFVYEVIRNHKAVTNELTTVYGYLGQAFNKIRETEQSLIKRFEPAKPVAPGSTSTSAVRLEHT